MILVIFTLPGGTAESGLASVALCWRSGCVGGALLSVYLTENDSNTNSGIQLFVSQNSPQTSI